MVQNQSHCSQNSLADSVLQIYSDPSYPLSAASQVPGCDLCDVYTGHSVARQNTEETKCLTESRVDPSAQGRGFDAAADRSSAAQCF